MYCTNCSIWRQSLPSLPPSPPKVTKYTENVWTEWGSSFLRIPAEQSKGMDPTAPNCVPWGVSGLTAWDFKYLETSRHNSEQEGQERRHLAWGSFKWEGGENMICGYMWWNFEDRKRSWKRIVGMLCCVLCYELPHYCFLKRSLVKVNIHFESLFRTWCFVGWDADLLLGRD